MIIKETDEKKSQIATLEALATRRDASSDVRKRIEQEIRNIRSGLKGEEEAAYEINFHFGTAKNYAVIHDLRIEVEGRIAQIDHLVIVGRVSPCILTFYPAWRLISGRFFLRSTTRSQ